MCGVQAASWGSREYRMTFGALARAFPDGVEYAIATSTLLCGEKTWPGGIMGRSGSWRFACALLGLAVIVGCRDESPSMVAPSLPDATTLGSSDAQLRVTSRFRVDLDAKGTFRPGDQVTLTARVAAPYGASRASITVSAPELTIAEQSGWRS